MFHSSSGSGQAAATNLVHLLLCTNKIYLQHTAVCLTSLLSNNPDLCFDIVLVRRTDEEIDEEKLRRTLAHFPNHSLLLREFSLPTDPHLPLNPRTYYSLDNWTRLWVEEFFPDDVERVLYLDGDIVVTGSIAALWQADLHGSLLGAVDIPGSIKGVTELEMRAEDGYFNSGVLLIDLKQWRETHALTSLLRYVETFPERLSDLDQDALNACFCRRRKRLDYGWNATWSFYREAVPIPVASKVLESIRKEARIIHFNGASKPWTYFCDHPRKMEYYQYLRLTEWRDFVPTDRTAINIAKKHISAVLPTQLKSILKCIMKAARSSWQSPRGTDPRTGASAMGGDTEQSRKRTSIAGKAGERDGAA